MLYVMGGGFDDKSPGARACDERTGEERRDKKTSEKGVSYTSEVRTRGGRAEEGVVDTRHEL